MLERVNKQYSPKSLLQAIKAIQDVDGLDWERAKDKVLALYRLGFRLVRIEDE